MICRLQTLPTLIAYLALLLSRGPVLGADAAASGLKFFETQIRPLLADNCYECHSATKKKGGLRLDNLPYILSGGEGGAAVVPGQPEKSLLLEFVSYKDSDHEMPPNGKLSEQQLNSLRQWIAMGAPWPEAETSQVKTVHKPGTITDEDRQWWAFQPVKAVPVPKNNAPSPIDAFIRQRLDGEGLPSAPEASRTELIRRLTFDLHGLPPTPEQVAAFIADKRPDAYERLVDELLQSPRFGERQAQHWLDLVRYAESDGYRQDAYRPNVWPYRDYVIESFNSDKPYNQFVREQIAGDEIAPNDPKVAIGTAFLRHTIYEYNQRDSETQWRGILNEVTDVTADVFMGMSLQCAQCHDHKFDPILQKDYYRLQAFFNNITWPEDKPLATEEERQAHDQKQAAWEAATVEPRKIIDAIIEPRVEAAQRNAMEKFPAEVYAMFLKPREQRSAYEEQVVQLAWRQAAYERVRLKEDKLKPEDAAKLAAARAQLATFDSLKPAPFKTAFVIGETGLEAMPVSFKTRKTGNVSVSPGYLTILNPEDAQIPPPPPGSATSGRRTVLADWLTRPTNPLTTRVIVNRIWQHHFGKGIVATPSDFGRLGEKPTHPELLDWLTDQFVQGGWRMKPLHKMIVMSATYRQTAHFTPPQAALLKDPDNRFLWRFNPLRLDAEQARDAVLAASGELKFDMGGEGVPASLPRRSVYTKKIRNTQDDFLRSLDAPSGFQSMPERQPTTTATQSLLLVNGDWPLDRARAMATHLSKLPQHDDSALVHNAYLSTLARAPAATETKAAIGFLQTQRAQLRKESPPPPPAQTPFADASVLFGTDSAARTHQAMLFKPSSSIEKLRVPVPAAQTEPNTFTIESVVVLDSLYPDAAVRTIASRWNNGKTEPGWSFGITSAKSAYKPNNLIVQLSGDDFQGSQAYEVAASGLRIPTGKPYYVAATISDQTPPGQPFGGTVTFYARDLSDPTAPMQTATVSHLVCGGYINPQRSLYIGGRETDKRSLWDGAIARVSLRSGPLAADQLMKWDATSCIIDVNADEIANAGKSATKAGWIFESSQPTSGSPRKDINLEALADLCHALINSNEFFYLQ